MKLPIFDCFIYGTRETSVAKTKLFGQLQFFGFSPAHLRTLLGGGHWKEFDGVLLVRGFELVAKTLNQSHSTELRDMGILEGKMDFSATFWAVAQSTPLGAFVPQRYLCCNYGYFSSESPSSEWSQCSFFTHN